MTRALVRLAARNAGRRIARTLLTAGMVLFGVALLMTGLSWIHGIFAQVFEELTAMGGHVRIVDPAYAAREELNPLDANLGRAPALAALLAAQSGVRAVEPRILTGATVTAGREIGDVFAPVIGSTDRYFRERLRAADRLVAGRWMRAPDELVLGSRVAKEARARVGSEIVLLGLTQDGALSPLKGRVAGIVHGGLLDRQILAPLGRIQWLADVGEGATELLVFGDGYAEGAALKRRLRALPALKGLAVQSWEEREPFASSLGTIRAVQGVVVAVIVLLTAVGIWNTMMTSVLERTREIGVMRAMGLSRGGVVALICSEAAAIGLLGGLAGVLLGAIPSWLLQHYGIRVGEDVTARITVPLAEVIRGRLTPGVAAFAFGLGLVMALLGALPAALRAAAVQPVTAMRAGR